ncbi:MAG: hypothetical protein FJW39_29310 [Acidobacteria bacterium]|nr:hypothetical protein [Acidobacteriota bacterium]
MSSHGALVKADLQRRPGYKVTVLDNGAVWVNLPAGWIMDLKPNTVMLRDGPEKVESADLGLMVVHLTAEGFMHVPVENFLFKALEALDEVSPVTSPVHTIRRADAKIVWVHQDYMCPKHHREACHRTAMVRGIWVQCLVTLSYWRARAPVVEPVWDEVLRSFTLGVPEGEEIPPDDVPSPFIQ